MYRSPTAALVFPALLAFATAATAAPLAAPPPHQHGLPGIVTVQSTIVIAPTAPPPPEVETIPAPPSAAVYWTPGHWAWNGATWTWTAGVYVQRPQPTAVWTPGHWEQQPNGYVWVDGRWSTS